MNSYNLSASARRILMNTVWLGIATLATRVLSLILVGVLSRQTGIEGVGTYNLATAVASYFLLFADFGLSNYTMQRSSANSDITEDQFNKALKLKTNFLFFSLPGVMLAAFLVARSLDQLLVVLFICFGAITASFSSLNYALFRSRERLGIESALTVFSSIIFLLLATWAIGAFHSLAWVGVAYLISTLVELLMNSAMRRHFFFRAHIPLTTDWQFARSSFPFAITSLVSTAFTQIDVVLMAFITTITVIGEYTAVSRLLLVAQIVPLVLGTAIWPATARLYTSDRRRFRQVSTQSVGLNLGIAGGIAVFLWGMSQEILSRLYGDGFGRLAPLLQLGGVFVCFKFLSLTIGTALTAAGRQGNRARAVLIGLLATVVLVIVLVPIVGSVGAVWALILSEIVLTLTVSYYARDLIHWSRVGRFTVGFAVTAAVCVLFVNGLLLRFANLDRIVVGLIPSLLYGAVVFSTIALFYARQRGLVK